jgi:hypothetical protein
VVTDDRPYIQVNDRERERLRGFINRLDDDALAAPANEYWTVAGVLGHLAYWDNRVLVFADKIDRGEPWVPSDAEPEGDWLTDSTRPIIHAIAPRAAAELALRIAEETDARVAELPWTGWLRSTRIVPSIQPAASTEVSTSTSWRELSATAAERRSLGIAT